MSTYELLRQFADSWALLAMLLLFLGLVGWALRPAARRHYDDAANLIFRPDSLGSERDD
jgi:cytochrome c oxidase cbb3-type subunit IV